MNIWNAIDTLGVRITDDRLRSAWARMLETHAVEDCDYAAYVAEYIARDTSPVYMRVALLAGDYAQAERRIVQALIKAGVKP